MKCKLLAASFLLVLASVLGCNDPTVSEAESSMPTGVTPIAETFPVELPAAENEDSPVPNANQETQEQDKPGMLDRASDLYNKSKKAADAGDAAKKWLSDKLQDANESGGQTAEDTAKWANDMYKSLKKQGLTSANDASQWLSDDIRNMNAWHYKVVRMTWDNPEETEKQMNDLGKVGWECFHVSDKDSRTVFFFKKSKKSYLKNIPVKDMLRLIPLMGGGDEE